MEPEYTQMEYGTVAGSTIDEAIRV